MPVLSILIFLPLIGSILIALSPVQYEKYLKWFNLFISFIGLFFSAMLVFHFDKNAIGYQFLEQTDWITVRLGSMGTLSIDYLLGVDGISLPLVVLAAVIQVIGAISSFEINTKIKGYHSLYLLLSASVMGCFLALDFFLFFLFFEFMLLPMYFLIGIWGGKNKESASIKFFIYTLVGSVFILLVMIGLYLSVADPIGTAIANDVIQNPYQITSEVIAGIQKMIARNQIPVENIVHTFDFRFLADPANYLPNSLLSTANVYFIGGIPARFLAFILLFIGFAIKLPLVPFHTWLPDAHVEAPTAISVILAGTLLKIGGYGFIRIAYSFFNDAAVNYAYWIALSGVIAIIWGALNALAQTDFKRQIAYSSVSHMGFVVIGIASLTSEGVNGAVFQMFSHGILSAMLFLIVGVIYSRTGDREIKNFQGLAGKMPVFTFVVVVAFFASLGLPGLSGFIGEFFSLMGSFNTTLFPDWITAIAALGIVMGACYFLWTFRRMFLGKYWINKSIVEITDLDIREKVMLFSLSLFTLILGIMPQLIFDFTSKSVQEFLSLF